MKKMIFLLILPLSLLMAIDFTMSKEGLFPKTTIIQPPASDETTNNPYLEAVEIPAYDSKNPEHLLITVANGKWTEANLNNPSYTNFYIEPGDYGTDTGAYQHTITRSGTATKRRTLALYNGNNIHPAKLANNEVAMMRFHLQAASYWTFDRIAIRDCNYNDYVWYVGEFSSNITFNRVHLLNSYAAMRVENQCHNLVVQQSRFDTMSQAAFNDDVAMINIVDGGSPFEVFNTKITGNEFVDCKPGRVNRYANESAATPHGQYANFNGTIFAYNTAEYTTAKRTDGNGNFTPTGDYYAGETTGFEFKSGSNDVNNPCIVEHNHIWGFRVADETFGDLSNAGAGFLAYMGSNHVKIRYNYIFDGTDGIFISDRYDEPYGTDYLEIHDNTIVDCGTSAKHWTRSLRISNANNYTIKNNIIKDSRDVWATLYGNFNGGYLGLNDVINPGAPLDLTDNATLDTSDGDNIYNTPAEGGYTEDYSFTTDKFTNNPRVIKLKNVLKPN